MGTSCKISRLVAVSMTTLGLTEEDNTIKLLQPYVSDGSGGQVGHYNNSALH
jgi:hypothetical protein